MTIDREEICQIISSILGIDVELIRAMNEEDFTTYGMTSIDAIQLVVVLEEKYKFEFKDEDLLFDKFNTLNKLLRLLERY